MSTKFYSRPSGAYTGEAGLSNRTKYQDDSAASPRVPISSSKIDGDINYLVDAVNSLYDTAVSGVVADGSITNTKLRSSTALSVIGRSANSSGAPADIVAASDGDVLRRSGTSVGFGQIGTTGITDSAVTAVKIADTNVTFAKIQNVNTATVLGRSTSGAGSVEALTLGSNLSISGGVLSGPSTATTSTAGVIQLRAGMVVQAVSATNAAVVTCNVTTPFDNTIPQASEGVEITSVSITPTGASNNLRVRFGYTASGNAGGFAVGYVTRDSGTDALTGSPRMAQSSAGNNKINIAGEFVVSAGSTSATTFKLIGGVQSGVVFYVNADSGATRLFGGASAAYITVEELVA